MSIRYAWEKKSVELGIKITSVQFKEWPYTNGTYITFGYCAASHYLPNADFTTDLAEPYMKLMNTNAYEDGDLRVPAASYPYFGLTMKNNVAWAQNPDNINVNRRWYYTTTGGTVYRFRLHLSDGNGNDLPFNLHERASVEGSTSYGYVTSSSSTAYPTSSGGAELNGYWYIYQGSDNIDPRSISYPTEGLKAGQAITVSVSASNSNIYGGTITYKYQYSRNNGAWTDLKSTTATSVTYTIPDGTTAIQFRVQASDNMGFTSTDYVTGAKAAIESFKMYVGVNGTARAVSKAYIGVNGTAREAIAGYIGIDGVARKWL